MGYGGDFPPRLDLFHRNRTSPGHFRAPKSVRGLFLTLESSFSCDLRSLRDITDEREVVARALWSLLPLRPGETLQSVSVSPSRAAQMGRTIPTRAEQRGVRATILHIKLYFTTDSQNSLSS